MSSPRDSVLLEYGGLANGATLSGQLCPSCRGGVTNEASMSVGNRGGLLWWRCHRNKCSFRGVHGASVSRQEGQAQHAEGRWNYERQPLSKDWLAYLEKRFRIPNEILDKEWEWTDSYGGRVVFPIRNESGHLTGYALRSYTDDKPKVLNHRVREELSQAWFQNSPYPRHVVLVEDIPSALRMAQATGMCSIALLGTTVPDALLDTMKFKWDYNPMVVVALDQDATVEAALNVVSMRSRVENVKLLALDKDIKDQDDDEFRYTIRRIKDL